MDFLQVFQYRGTILVGIDVNPTAYLGNTPTYPDALAQPTSWDSLSFKERL
jgi:hypothetical protein